MNRCLSIFVCMCAAILTSPASGEERVWILNGGSDANRCRVGQGIIQNELGIVTLKPTGTDMTLSFPLKESERFEAEDYPFFALRYKAKTTLKQGGLFFTTDKLPELSDASYSQFAIETCENLENGEYHNLVVDMRNFPHDQWHGMVNFFRLDPTNPSDTDSEICISRLGFFANQTDAEQFLHEAKDTPDYGSPAVFTAPMQKAIIPENTLSPGYQKSDFLLENTIPKGDVNDGIPVVFCTDATGVKQVVACHVNSIGFVTYIANRLGKYTLEYTGKKYTDIQNHPLQKAINYVTSHDLMEGTSATEFSPDAVCDLAEIQTARAKLTERGVKNAAQAFDSMNSYTRADVAQILMACECALFSDTTSPYSSEYFTRKRIKIGSWANFDPEKVDEAYIRDYADAGFDWIISMPEISSEPCRSRLFSLCNKYGVEVYINDGAFNQVPNGVAEYFDTPCFTGHYVIDEPGSDDFDRLSEVCNAYTAKMGKVPYVNLLPMYANAAQLKYGAGAAAIEYYDADPALFRKYCEAFCEKFNTPYICTDIYPLNWNGDKKTTYGDYVESIHVIADVARRYDREFWCYIQTFGWMNGKRTPNEAEFRWQSYSMLSFGCTGIICWTWGGYDPEFPSLVDTESRKTKTYYDAKKVFQEVKKISDIYVQYQYLGTFNHQCTEKTPYLRMSDPYTDFDHVIEKIECDDPLLIGCFAKREGSGNAFTIVNMSELQDAKTITVCLKLAENVGKTVTAYLRGEPVVLDMSEGLYTIELPTGEGVFVTIE